MPFPRGFSHLYCAQLFAHAMQPETGLENRDETFDDTCFFVAATFTAVVDAAGIDNLQRVVCADAARALSAATAMIREDLDRNLVRPDVVARAEKTGHFGVDHLLRFAVADATATGKDRAGS